MIKITWNANIPLVGNQLAEDWPDINENFTHLKDFLANIVNSWDNTTATSMFIAKTKRTALTYADSPYTMLDTDVLLEVDASGGAVTINAISAATLGAGRYFIVKVTDATNDVTIEPDGVETIDGASNLVISTTNHAYVIYSDGTNLKVLSFYADWFDQALKTTSSPTFADLTVTGNVASSTITLSGTPSGSPTANKIYKDSIVKGWVNFDGAQATIVIRDSFNVASVVDNGTGDYTVNWDTDFANADYCVVGTCGYNTQGENLLVQSVAAGAVQVYTDEPTNGTNTDSSLVCVMAIGDQ